MDTMQTWEGLEMQAMQESKTPQERAAEVERKIARGEEFEQTDD